MNHKVFCIFDEKAAAYLLPFFLPTEGMATRGFEDAVMDREHMFGKHPEDYTLMCLGDFDDGKAKFSPYEIPRAVVNGRELLELRQRRENKGSPQPDLFGSGNGAAERDREPGEGNPGPYTEGGYIGGDS